MKRNFFLQTKMTTTPDRAEADFVLFSIAEPASIERYLQHFPQEGDTTGVSSTVCWSSKTSILNVPVQHFVLMIDDNAGSPVHCGFVLNPERVSVPQADLHAASSMSQLATEKSKSSKTWSRTGYQRY